MKINVKVIANSSRDSIERISEGEYKVHLKEKAVKGKANKALIGLLSGHFQIKKSQIQIVRGLMSNQKIIAINQE